MSSSARPSQRSSRQKAVESGRTFNPVASMPQKLITKSRDQITVQMEDVVAFVTTAVGAPAAAAKAFTLASFGGFAEYQAVFDQYKIDEIEVWVTPSGVGNPDGTYWTAIDLDDNTTPGSQNAVSLKQGAVCSGMSAGHYHCFKPNVEPAAAQGASRSFAAEPMWCDSAFSDINHYGLKIYSTATPGGAINLALRYRARVSFRAPGI